MCIHVLCVIMLRHNPPAEFLIRDFKVLLPFSHAQIIEKPITRDGK